MQRIRRCFKDADLYIVRDYIVRGCSGREYYRRQRIKRLIKETLALGFVAFLGCSTIVHAVSGNGTGLASGGSGSPIESVSGNTSANENDVINAGTNAGPDNVCGEADTVSQNVCMGKENPVKLPEDIRIVLDPGHGGEDEGCSKNGVEEKVINLQIAREVQRQLEEMGYQVVLTREGDWTCPKEERVQTANAAAADLYVSIHQNADESAEPSGVEVWYCEGDYGKEGRRLAKLLQKYVVAETDAREREIGETDSLYVIRESDMPSCLIETGFLTNAAERRKLTEQEYQKQIARGIAEGIDLYFYPKTMYLTFDDGPSAENTGAVLDVLKERGIRATFFVVGENVEKHPEIARRIVAEGHTIGIHCYRHDYKEIYASADSYLADFEKAYEIVYETTGVKVKLFRFPGGSVNSHNQRVYKEIIQRMTERGFVYFDWNASLEDAVTHADAQTLIENAKESALGRKKVVMLGHDIIYSTAVCLNDLIDAFPEYQMEPITPDTAPIQF